MSYLLPVEIINHIMSYAITPISKVLKNDIENFVKTREQIYEIYHITRIRPILLPLPTLHFMINHILAFDYRFGNGISILPHENNMKWGALIPERRNYLLYDLVFYYNIEDRIKIEYPI
jgi:hypothetical protein